MCGSNKPYFHPHLDLGAGVVEQSADSNVCMDFFATMGTIGLLID